MNKTEFVTSLTDVGHIHVHIHIFITDQYYSYCYTLLLSRKY